MRTSINNYPEDWQLKGDTIMYVEDQINAIRQQTLQTPFGWLICFESRPLQGLPPKGNRPHIMFFSAENQALAFITGRKKFFGEEPLSAVAMDSASSLKAAALNPSSDVRYATPPCGIVVDFDYSTAKARKIISPADVNSMLPVEIAGAAGLKMSPASEIKAEPVKPASPGQPEIVIDKPAPESLLAAGESTQQKQSARTGQIGEQVPAIGPKPRSGQKRSFTTLLITCGSLLLVGLLVLCIVAAWFGMKRGAIPALPFLYTPTFTATPTNTATSTAVPTATATPVVWIVNVQDEFTYNLNGWPVGANSGKYGSADLAISNGKLVFGLESVENCWFWYYPDIPSVSDLVAAIDVQRVDGSTSGDYGLILRSDGDANSFYYLAINDSGQTFAFFRYQNDNWTTLQDWTVNQVIGVGRVNHIEVRATGTHFTIVINGIVVGQVDDAGLSSGKVGVFVQLHDAKDKITIQYDNLDLQGNP
jgi:hypothetical protein